MTTLTVSEARAALPALLRRVEQGDQVTITRHGQPIAVLVRPDRVAGRATDAMTAASRLRELLDRPADADTDVVLSAARAEQLVREIRRGRDAG